MRIQIFTRNFLGGIPGFDVGDLKPVGGAEVYLHDLALMLKRDLGFDVDILQLGSREATVQLEDYKVRFITLPRSTGPFLFPLYLARRFAAEEDSCALTIYNYPRYAYLRRIQDAGPAIGIHHGIEWDSSLFSYASMEYKYRRGVLGPLAAVRACAKYMYFARVAPYLFRKGVGRLERVVSVDRNSLRYLPPALLPRIVVIPNCVDEHLFHPDVKPVPIHTDRRVILVPRNLNVARGVQLIPAIAKSLRSRRSDFLFLVVGTGPLRRFLVQQIERHGLADCVRLAGHVDHDEMPHYYAASSLVLIPSIFSEGTSLSALEAMACGKPTMMSDIGGLCEIGEDGKSKLAVVPTVDGLVGKLDAFLDDSFDPSLGARAREDVLNNHRKELWKQAWASVIKRTLDLGERD